MAATAQGIFEACGREHYGPPKYLGKVSIFVSGSALGICYVCVLFSTMHVDSSCCFKTIMLVLFCMAALASGTSPHLWT